MYTKEDLIGRIIYDTMTEPRYSYCIEHNADAEWVNITWYKLDGHGSDGMNKFRVDFINEKLRANKWELGGKVERTIDNYSIF